MVLARLDKARVLFIYPFFLATLFSNTYHLGRACRTSQGGFRFLRDEVRTEEHPLIANHLSTMHSYRPVKKKRVKNLSASLVDLTLLFAKINIIHKPTVCVGPFFTEVVNY